MKDEVCAEKVVRGFCTEFLVAGSIIVVVSLDVGYTRYCFDVFKFGGYVSKDVSMQLLFDVLVSFWGHVAWHWFDHRYPEVVFPDLCSRAPDPLILFKLYLKRPSIPQRCLAGSNKTTQGDDQGREDLTRSLT